MSDRLVFREPLILILPLVLTLIELASEFAVSARTLNSNRRAGFLKVKHLVDLVRSLSNAISSPLTRAIKACHRLVLAELPMERPPRTLPKRAKQLNALQLDILLERHGAGATVYDLADRFAIDHRTVSLCLKRMGVSLRGQSSSEDAVNKMIRLF